MVMAGLLEAMVVEEPEPKHGGSRKGRRANKNRQRATGHKLLWDDYFSDTPANTPEEFRRRFRINRVVFRNIVHGVRDYDDYFELKQDCVGLLGFSSLQKRTAAIRCLAYGTPADSLDDYLRMSETTAVEATFRFCKAVVAVFGPMNQRLPNEADTTRLLA